MKNYNTIFQSKSSEDTILKWTSEPFKVFVAADKAFDSWIEKIDSKKFLQSSGFKTEDKFFYWMSIGLNSAFKTYSDIGKRTISIHEIKLSSEEAKKTHFANLLYLKSGDYAQHINRTEIMHDLNFKAEVRAAFPNRTDGKYSNYRNTKVVDIENKIQLSIRGKTTAGKNRILAIVALFEALSFYFQYGAWQEDVKGEPELAVQLTGAFFTVIGASLELIGENVSKTSLAGNLTRVAAGSFTTLGGIIGIIVDVKASMQTNSQTIKMLMFSRIIINTSLLIGQVSILFSSILKIVGGKYAFNLGEKIASNWIIAFLIGARTIFGGVVLNIVLLSGEYLLRKFYLDDAMEDWCQKSAFRLSNKSKETPFKNEAEEQEAFVQALVKVI